MCGDSVHVFMDSFNTSFLHHYTLVIPLCLAPSCVLHVPHVNISQSYSIFMKQHIGDSIIYIHVHAHHYNRDCTYGACSETTGV